jgi:hypothetical protein
VRTRVEIIGFEFLLGTTSQNKLFNRGGQIRHYLLIRRNAAVALLAAARRREIRDTETQVSPNVFGFALLILISPLPQPHLWLAFALPRQTGGFISDTTLVWVRLGEVGTWCYIESQSPWVLSGAGKESIWGDLPWGHGKKSHGWWYYGRPRPSILIRHTVFPSSPHDVRSSKRLLLAGGITANIRMNRKERNQRGM